MTLRMKLIGVLGSLISLFAYTILVIFLNLQMAATKLEQASRSIEHTAGVGIPLMLNIKEIKSDIIQVQQWLSDISATRAPPRRQANRRPSCYVHRAISTGRPTVCVVSSSGSSAISGPPDRWFWGQQTELFTDWQSYFDMNFRGGGRNAAGRPMERGAAGQSSHCARAMP